MYIDFNFLGNFILTLVGIIALVFLILALKNISSLVKSVQEILDKNADNVDDIIEKLPGVVDQANMLVSNVNTVVQDPNLRMAIAKANDTMTNVNSITDDIRDTVNYVGETAIDSIDTVGAGIASVGDYSSLIIDVVDIVKGVISGR